MWMTIYIIIYIPDFFYWSTQKKANIFWFYSVPRGVSNKARTVYYTEIFTTAPGSFLKAQPKRHVLEISNQRGNEDKCHTQVLAP